MSKKKIVGIFIIILLIFSTTTFSIARIGKVEQQLENNFSITTTPILPLTQQQNILTFGFSGDADKLDPGDITEVESIARVDNIFEGLVKYAPGTADLQPGLATNWEISPDRKTIKFTLRSGATFHDGTDFNADAVVFSFERQFNTSHPYHQYGEWEYWNILFSDVIKVEKIDTYIVNITLGKPNAGIIKSFAMHTAAIVSPANAEKWKEDAYKHPVGTGPFKFVEWVKDDHITLEANQDYWQGKPKIDTLIFRVIKDSSDRLEALKNNIIQGMENPDPNTFEIIKADENLMLLEGNLMSISNLAINNGYGYYDTNENGVRDNDEPWVKNEGYFEPFTNKLVRQAINYAINKTFIVENIYNGTAIVAKTCIPPTMLGYNEGIIDYNYDPDKARELLIEARYPNGFNTTLWVRQGSSIQEKLGGVIKEFLEDVNITVEVYEPDLDTYFSGVGKGEHPMCFQGWQTDNGDPDNFMTPLYSANKCIIGNTNNWAFYNNNEVQDLISAALEDYNDDNRALLYKEAQMIMHQDAGLVYLTHSNQYLVFRSNVKGFIMNPTGRLFFFPVEVENKPNEPEGKVIFSAHSTGPCAIALGYWLGPGPNPTPDAYIETGKGVIINFGTMPYHSLNNPYFTNYLIENNEVEVLWNIREKTFMKVNWQHESINHHLQVTCTPLGETTGTFSLLKSYLICVPPMLSNPKNPESNCMAFTGVHRIGSKTEHISGYAIFGASTGVNDSFFSLPIIPILLFQITDTGEMEPLLTVLWARETLVLPGMEIPLEKANTFHINFWRI